MGKAERRRREDARILLGLGAQIAMFTISNKIMSEHFDKYVFVKLKVGGKTFENLDNTCQFHHCLFEKDTFMDICLEKFKLCLFLSLPRRPYRSNLCMSKTAVFS